MFWVCRADEKKEKKHAKLLFLWPGPREKTCEFSFRLTHFIMGRRSRRVSVNKIKFLVSFVYDWFGLELNCFVDLREKGRKKI